MCCWSSSAGSRDEPRDAAASYSVKDIAPRIVLGFVGANLSMVVISQAITSPTACPPPWPGRGSPATAAASLMTTLGNSISTGGIFLILLALAGVVLALVLAMVYVLRLMAVVLLAAAPLRWPCMRCRRPRGRPAGGGGR